MSLIIFNMAAALDVLVVTLIKWLPQVHDCMSPLYPPSVMKLESWNFVYILLGNGKPADPGGWTDACLPWLAKLRRTSISQPPDKILKNPLGHFFGLNMWSVYGKFQLSWFKTESLRWQTVGQTIFFPAAPLYGCTWQKSTTAKFLNFSARFAHGG